MCLKGRPKGVREEDVYIREYWVVLGLSKGRPKGVREEDVYICEYWVVFDVSEGTS